jgi:hypothetical protein
VFILIYKFTSFNFRRERLLWSSYWVRLSFRTTTFW